MTAIDEEGRELMEREASHAVILAVLFIATVICGWIAGLL